MFFILTVRLTRYFTFGFSILHQDRGGGREGGTLFRNSIVSKFLFENKTGVNFRNSQ